MKKNSIQTKIWFFIAVFLAAAMLLGLLISSALGLKMWSIIFAVLTFLSAVHVGAVGVFYVAEHEIMEMDAELYEEAKKN